MHCLTGAEAGARTAGGSVVPEHTCSDNTHVHAHADPTQVHIVFCVYVQITHMFMLMLTPHMFIFEPRAYWFGAEDDLFSYILIHMFCFTRVDKRPPNSTTLILCHPCWA